MAAWKLGAEPKMHQTIQQPPTRHAPPTSVLDLARDAALIHLGPVEAPRHFDLALQALNKLLRCGNADARLLMSTSDRCIWSRTSPSPHIHILPLGELRQALRHCTTVLAPAFSDPQGSLTLHALASGVPLGALNLATFSLQERAALPLDHALLAIARIRPRPH